MPAPTPFRRPFQRYMRWISALLGGYFLITAVLSLMVNPWRINRTPLSIDALDGARDIRKCVRVGKAALANSGDWQVVLFGSSRVEQAFDPEHPAFAGKRTVNLAMAAASILETVPVGHYTLDRNPDIEVALFGIDAGDLHDDFDSRKFTRFYESPFADNNLSIERGINQIIGGRSLLDSIGTIRRHFSGEQPDRSPLGQWVHPDHPANLRAYVTYAFEGGFEVPAKAWQVKPENLRRHKADLLRDFIIRVRREGIRMHVFVPPQHALKIIHPELDRPDRMCWETDLRALAAICEEANRVEAAGPPVELWSFLDFHPLSTRPLPPPGAGQMQMEGWYDLGHAQESIGAAAIGAMMGMAPTDGQPPFGIRLALDNWEPARDAWIAAHQRYCANHPDDVEWLRDLARKAAESKVQARQMVEEVPE